MPVIHEAPLKKALEIDRLIPGLATVKKQFEDLGIDVVESDKGGLVVATRKPKKIEMAVAGTAPEEIRGNVPKTEEYYDFPPKLITSLLDAHKDGIINLHSADKKQFAIYIAKIMRACGFTSDSGAFRIIQAFVNEKKDGSESLKNLVRGHFAEHPHINKMKKTRGNYNMGVKTKVKKYDDGDVPYDNLALTLMPEIWDSLDSSQKKQFVKSLLLLHEMTNNFREIDAPRLHERLAEICTNEKEMSLRYNIYALLESVPYESLTATTKNYLAIAMIRHNEFGTDIAFSLLTESKGISVKKEDNDGLIKLWPIYEKYEKKVLETLSQPIDDLAMTDDVEWLTILDSVTRLSPYALIQQPKSGESEPIMGIELEFAPFNQDNNDPKVAVKNFSDTINDARNYNLLLDLSTDVDQDCAEVRTGDGGVSFNIETLHSLQKAFQALQHSQPLGWWATMHLHIDNNTCDEGLMAGIYEDCNISTEHSTHEIRSLPSPNLYADGPTIGTELHRVSITRLACLAKFGLRSADVPVDINKEALGEINLDSLNHDARIRKLLAISLCGNDPSQRAAVLYTMHTSPMFLSPAFLIDAVARTSNDYDDINLLKAGINIVPKEARRGYLKEVDASDRFGTSVLRELYAETSDKEYKEEIIEIISIGSTREDLRFLIDNYPHIESHAVKRSIIIRVIIDGGRTGIDILKKWFTEAIEIESKKIIVGTIACYGNNDGVAKLIEWYHESNEASIRENIIFELSNHKGGEVLPFLIGQYPKINDPLSKEAIILAVSIYGGENEMDLMNKWYEESTDSNIRKNIIRKVAENSDATGLPFLIRHYNEIKEDHNLRNAVATAVAKHGGESGMTILQEWCDQSGDDRPYRRYILYAVGRHSGETGWPFVIHNFSEVDDYDLRDSLIAWIAKSNDGKANISALKQIYLSVNDDATKNEIIETIMVNGRALSIKIIEELYQLEHNHEFKKRILYIVSRHTYNKVGLQFLIKHYREISDSSLLRTIQDAVNNSGDKANIDALAGIK